MGYNRWVPRNLGLVIWPTGGVLAYVIVLVTARGPQAAGGTRPSVILTVLLAVMLVNHVGALIVARNRTSRE